MYIIYVNHDSVIKQICQLRDKAFLINETLRTDNLFTKHKRFEIFIKPQVAQAYYQIEIQIVGKLS